jgi:hypothetical protein
MAKEKAYAIGGFRLGMRFLTSAGLFVNGGPAPKAILAALKGSGFSPKVCTDSTIAPSSMSQEREEMRAANRTLGIDEVEGGKARLQADIDKGMREVLAPLRKSTHLK